MNTSDDSRYAEFEEAEFISDPFFQDWVIHAGAEKEDFWNGFLVRYPEKKTAVQAARTFLQNMPFAEYVPDDALIQQALNRHLAQIEAIDHQRNSTPVRSFYRKYRSLLRFAAIFGGTAMLTVAYFTRGTDKKTIVQTAYGQLTSVILPDSSAIVLNAHSKVVFQKKPQTGSAREVWLEGEAFFNVRHLNLNPLAVLPPERFIVHTGDLDIEVLGTSFDIRKRREKTEVVLQTGKIKLLFIRKSRPDIVMSPGEVVTYQPRENTVVRTTTTPEDYSAWKEKKLILNNPTVTEIIAYLEDNYGTKIILRDEKIGTRVIEGPILLNNLDDALFVLSTVLHADIIKKDGSLIIKPK